MPFKGNFKKTRPITPHPSTFTSRNWEEHIDKFILKDSDQAVSFCEICLQLARTFNGIQTVKCSQIKEYAALKEAVENNDAKETISAFKKQMSAHIFAIIEHSFKQLHCTVPLTAFMFVLNKIVSSILSNMMHKWALACWKNPYKALVDFHKEYRAQKGVTLRTPYLSAVEILEKRSRLAQQPYKMIRRHITNNRNKSSHTKNEDSPYQPFHIAIKKTF